MKLQAAVFLAFVAFVSAKTIVEVDQCQQQKASKCHTKCASEIPKNMTTQVQCMEQLMEAMHAEVKQCLLSSGLTDDLPCFSFNHSFDGHALGKHHGFGAFGSIHSASSSSEKERPKGVHDKNSSSSSSSSEEGKPKGIKGKSSSSSSSEEGKRMGAQGKGSSSSSSSSEEGKPKGVRGKNSSSSSSSSSEEGKPKNSTSSSSSSSSEEGKTRSTGGKKSSESASKEVDKDMKSFVKGKNGRHHGRQHEFVAMHPYKQCVSSCMEVQDCQSGCAPIDKKTKQTLFKCMKSQKKEVRLAIKKCFQKQQRHL